MRHEELMEQIAAGRFPPVCVLSGSERLLMERAIRGMRELVAQGGVSGLNDDLFHGSAALSATSIVQTARTLPMLARHRFVLVRAVDALAVGEQDILLGYAKQPCAETCLVLASDKLDGRSKLAKAAKEGGFLVEYQAPKPFEIPALATREAEARGHSLSSAAAAALAEAVGTDLSALDDALERLSLYVGDREPIEAAHVDACVAQLRTESVWALVDSVSQRDARGTLKAAASLLDDREPPLKILGLIARQLRIVARMRDALASGLRPQDAAIKAGAPPFKAAELARSAKRFDDTQLRQAFRVLAETDLALKGSKVPGPRILENALLALCAGA